MQVLNNVELDSVSGGFLPAFFIPILTAILPAVGGLAGAQALGFGAAATLGAAALGAGAAAGIAYGIDAADTQEHSQ